MNIEDTNTRRMPSRFWRAVKVTLALLIAACSLGIVGSNSAVVMAAPPGVLDPGTILTSGQGLYSQDGTYWLVMQSDGNLVLYSKLWPATTWSAIWSSGTWGRPANSTYLVMQTDGNLVLYTYLFPAPAAVAIWSTNTAGNPGATLRLQNDGNLVVGNAGRALWATMTIPPLRPITNGLNRRCLDADLNTINVEGTKIQLWDCNYQAQQEFKFIPNADGTFTIFNKYSWRCLTSDGSTTADGAGVSLFSCNGGANQKWRRVGNQLISAFSGKCLDADATNGRNGTRVQIWGCNGSNQQVWVDFVRSADVGALISREEIFARAVNWMNYPQVYNTGGWQPDGAGRLYRTDCSGFVSMAWRLPSSPSTATLPSVSYPISYAALKLGDILNVPIAGPGGHVRMFASWVDAAKTTYNYIDFGGGVGPVWGVGTLADRKSGRLYDALRYNNLMNP